jgi:glycosyltransferase involved in cell wall biosynthesis
VVASTAGGIPEILRDGEQGLLVPPHDPAALARAILRTLGDLEGARERARAGRRRILEEFSVDRMVEGTLAVYGELVNRGLGTGNVK